ncbi:hypothetical protein ACFL1E_06750 [Candidatus Omnitrophota bacterium]
MDKKRSIGVTIFGIVLIAISVISIFTFKTYDKNVHSINESVYKLYSLVVTELQKSENSLSEDETNQLQQFEKRLLDFKNKHIDENYVENRTLLLLFSYSNLLLFVTLAVSGIFLIKRINWSRIAVIYVTIAGFFVGLCAALSMHFAAKPVLGIYIQGKPLHDPQPSLFHTYQTGHLIGFSLSLLWTIFVIFFLTRPKVKEQFKN